LESTVVYTLQRDLFLRYLEDHPGLTRRALALTAERVNRLIAHTENLAFLDVPARLAAVLVEMAARYGVEHGGIEISLHLTQSELASWVIASREMVNKVLGTYRDQGLIRIEGQTITVLDLNGLKRRITG